MQKKLIVRQIFYVTQKYHFLKPQKVFLPTVNAKDGYQATQSVIQTLL